MQKESVGAPVLRYEKGLLRDAGPDVLAIEEPLEIRLRDAAGAVKSVSITMRTPGHDGELAAGFLFTEGILKNPDQILAIGHEAADVNVITISLQAGAVPVLQRAERNFYTTSSCGVCGKASIDAIRTVSPFGQERAPVSVRAEELCRLPGRLREAQAVFERTGGLHASGLFAPDGTFRGLREDVGRHNALDKLIGAAFLADDLPMDDQVLLLSGRASFELLQKASMAGIRIVAAIGAPSSLAVSLAVEAGISLIGFLRDGRFNVYSHPERISV